MRLPGPRRFRTGLFVIAALSVTVLAVTGVLAGPAGPASASPDTGGVGLVVRATDPLAPALVLTNYGTAACQIVTTSLGTVGVTALSQSGRVVQPISTDPSFPDSVETYLSGKLTTLAPGGSATIPLRVVPVGPTGHAIETVTWSRAGSLGELYPIRPDGSLRLSATYAVPVVPETGPPPCAVAAGGDIVTSAAGGSDRTLLLIVAGVVLLVLAIVAVLLVVLSRRRRRGAVAVAAAVLTLLAGTVAAGVWPARAAYATVTVDPSLAKAFGGCGPLFSTAGGDPAGILPTINDPKNVVKIVPANGDQTHEISVAGQIIIFWDPNDHHHYVGGGDAEPCSALYHEMYHGKEDLTGGQDHSECVSAAGPSGLPVNEVNATKAENVLRVKEGLPPRTTYGGTPLPAGPCLPKDQQPKPKPTCTGSGCGDSNGDPHLTTFDGLRYDFQAVGEFVAARDTASPDLQIQVRQQPLAGSTTVALTTAVAMAVAGDRVQIELTAAGVALTVNDTVAKLDAASLPHGGSIEVNEPGLPSVITVHWPDGSFLVASAIGHWGLHVTAQPAAIHAGRTVGLLGNFDGNRDNDLRAATGTAIQAPPAFGVLYPHFADGWRVTDATSLFTYLAGTRTASYTDRSFPDRPANVSGLPGRAAAQALCERLGVTDPATLDACVLDVAETGQADFAVAARDTQSIVASSPAGPGPSPISAGPTSTSTLGTSGTEATLTVDKPNGTAKVTFPGTAGQRLFVDILSSAVTSKCGVLDLVDPTGSTVDSGCVNGAGIGDIGGDLLPATGLYTLVFTPRDGVTGQMRVRLTFSTDQHGVMPADGSPVVATITTPGQVGLFTFTGQPGERVFVEVTASTLPNECGDPLMRGPDGVAVALGCLGQGAGYIDGTLLRTGGQYTVVVDPSDRAIGQATLRLLASHDEHGTIMLGGSPVTATVATPGQVSLFTFTGIKGQRIKVVVTASTLRSQCGIPILVEPSGTAFMGGCISADATGGIDAITLNVTGTWAIEVDPGEAQTGTVTFALRQG